MGIATDVEDAKQRKLRAQTLTGRAIEQLDVAIEGREGYVAFVSGSPESPRLELAPLDVGPAMAEGVWSKRTAVLTSATIPSSLATRVGIPADSVDVADVGSPFDYEAHSMLYCAMHMPNPNSEAFRPAVHDELEALITAAGGRTLALFTSWRSMDEAAEALRARVSFPIITQRDLPKPALVKAFAESAETCLFATAGLFQGVDVPGSTLSLVVIDRIPFPRPDDPLLSARREQLGSERVRRDRHPPGIDDARPGLRAVDPQCDGQGCRRRDGPAPRHRPLPMGHREGAPADEAHPSPRRRRDLPPRHHRRPTLIPRAMSEPVESPGLAHRSGRAVPGDERTRAIPGFGSSLREVPGAQASVLTLWSSAKACSRRVTKLSSPARSQTRGSYCFLFGASGPFGFPSWPCR